MWRSLTATYSCTSSVLSLAADPQWSSSSLQFWICLCQKTYWHSKQVHVYVAYSHVRATVDFALLGTVWNISAYVIASTCTLRTGTLFLCFPIMLIWSEANPTVKLIHIQCCMDGFSNATKRPTSGGQGTIKRQPYSEPFTLWEAASCIFQH